MVMLVHRADPVTLQRPACRTKEKAPYQTVYAEFVTCEACKNVVRRWEERKTLRRVGACRD